MACPTALHSAENHLRETVFVSNTRMRKHSLPDGQGPEGIPGWIVDLRGKSGGGQEERERVEYAEFNWQQRHDNSDTHLLATARSRRASGPSRHAHHHSPRPAARGGLSTGGMVPSIGVTGWLAAGVASGAGLSEAPTVWLQRGHRDRRASQRSMQPL